MEALFSNSHGVTNLTLSGIETISFGVNCSTTGTQIDVAINTNSAVRYTGGAEIGRASCRERVCYAV